MGSTLPLSQSWVESVYGRIRPFFNRLVRRGYIPDSLLRLVARPKVDEKVVRKVPQQVARALLDLVDPERGRANYRE
jgi:hypothetical protein